MNILYNARPFDQNSSLSVPLTFCPSHYCMIPELKIDVRSDMRAASITAIMIPLEEKGLEGSKVRI